jgi:two-component system cell cycle sensor histidine kinase/response regulator CckA
LPKERATTEDTDVFRVPALVSEDDDTGPIVVATRLVCVAGAEVGRTFGLGSKSLMIGRGGGVDVDVRLENTDVSRNHARLWADDKGFHVQDLGSLNGTFINGTRVDGNATLNLGDRIQVGSTIFVLLHHDELESRMRQLQRIDAMSTMVGGLAHDFRNFLTVILGGLENLDASLTATTDEQRQVIDDMKTATEGAIGLARKLLDLGRNQPNSFFRVSVLELVTESIRMAQRIVGASISIASELRPDAWVSGSRQELQQVLLNLLVNARDAMPDGGIVRISAQPIRFDRANASALHLPSDGEYIEVIVADTGGGMDEVTLARAFEPFFTTKPIGKGTGLGLAMVHSIVKRHSGTVIANSKLGSGTTFRILIPSAGSASVVP